MKAIGIDLGTTNTLSAYVNEFGTPVLIPDSRNAALSVTPSVAYVRDNVCAVGQAAIALSHSEKHLPIIRNAKLKIGSLAPVFDSHSASQLSAKDISCLILKKIKTDAEAELSQKIEKACLTIPANFDSTERAATMSAAKMAGFMDVNLVEEPVAAAASYCFESGVKEQTLFVYDLGGGTFDASVVHCEDGQLYTLSTLGSKEIGGQFFDELVLEDLEALYLQQHPSSKLSSNAKKQLKVIAENIKIKLTLNSTQKVTEAVLIQGGIFSFVYTWQRLASLVVPMLDKTLQISDQCVQDAGLSWNQIDTLLIVGGSSKLSIIETALLTLTKKQKDHIKSYQPSEAIACGAALLADGDNLEHGSGIRVKQQVASNNLGIMTYNPESAESELELLIERNSPLPKSVTKTLYTSQPKQQKMVIQLVQVKSLEERAEHVGKFEFGPFDNTQAHHPVEIRFDYTEEGVVLVSYGDNTVVFDSAQSSELSKIEKTFKIDDISVY